MFNQVNFPSGTDDLRSNFTFTNLLRGESGSDEVIQDSPYEDIELNCNYYSEDELKKQFADNSNLSMMSFNIQGLGSKFDQLNEMLTSLKQSKITFDIIALQECFSVPSPELFRIDNYHIPLIKNRKVFQRGGVGFLINDCLKFKELPELSVFIEKVIETVFIEVELQNKTKIIVGSIYRPPSVHGNLTATQQLDQFSESLESIINKVSATNKKSFFLGDFNLDLIKFNEHRPTNDFIDIFFSAGFIQLINHPTRVFGSSATLIDQIWTNCTNSAINSGIISCYISDHFPVFSFLDSKKPKQSPKELKIRDFNPNIITNFKSALSNLSFNDVYSENCAQTSYDNFHNIFFDLFNLYFPIKTVKFDKNYHRIEPWVTPGILASRRQKLKLSKILAKTPSNENKVNFRNYKNMYNKVIRRAKKDYFTKKIQDNQFDMKQTWDILRKATGQKKDRSSNIDQLLCNNRLISDSRGIANTLNTHFCSIASTINESILPTDRPPDNFNSPSIDNVFSLTSTSEIEIVSIFKAMKTKNSTDYQDLSSNFLSKCIDIIASPLKHIFNLSFQQGIVQNQLKIAKVVPIFKKGGSSENVNDYRPISLLSTFSKILEKLVSNRVVSFLQENNIIDKYQFGFQASNSTVHPMIHLLNKVSNALNQNHYTIAIFCDLQKAFDLVPHDVLLMKLRKIGFGDGAVEWFASYLSNRKQYVNANGVNSDLGLISSGVPQGSILGPILFLIFFNDLPQCTLLQLLLFADDTTILASGPDINDLVDFVNAELRKISIWFRSNKMALHPKKTQFTVFYSNESQIPWDDINIYFDNNDPNSDIFDETLINKLSYVNSTSETPAIKFLGVYFDPTLNFKYHIQQINKKLSKALFSLRRLKNFLPLKALKALYYSLFHSHLLYALPIYSSATNCALKCLITKQKAAIRIISGANYNAHTGNLFKNLNIMPFNTLISYFKIKLMFEFKHNLLPRSFAGVWSSNNEFERNADLRNSLDFRIPLGRTNLLQRLPLYSLPNEWNKLNSAEIKEISSLVSFKSKLKQYLMNNLQILPCNRLLCPACHLSALV